MILQLAPKIKRMHIEKTIYISMVLREKSIKEPIKVVILC